MIYMLDTNILIYALRRPDHPVHQRIVQHLRGDLCISMITLEELFKGAYKSSKPRENLQAIHKILAGFEILPFDEQAARQAGQIQAMLERAGTPIGDFDALIAGHAKALQLVLVTNNTREFSRIPDLHLEDWIER